MSRKVAGLVLALVACVALVSADRPGVADPKQKPVVTSVQGYVSDIGAYATTDRAVCAATVSDGKLGAGEQTHVYATDALLQMALISAAERQVLVEVQYYPEAAPGNEMRGRAIVVRLLDQPRYQRSQGK